MGIETNKKEFLDTAIQYLHLVWFLIMLMQKICFLTFLLFSLFRLVSLRVFLSSDDKTLNGFNAMVFTGSSASECDTISGKQAYFFYNKSF